MKKYLTLFLLLACCSVVALAQGVNQAQVKQQINKAAAELKTMQCDFVQTKHLKILNEKMVSRGKMYYQQSNRLRWEYTSPYSYTFLLNDNKVQIKTGKRNDVIDVNQNKVFKEIARIMMNSVVGKCLSDEKDFKTTIAATPTEWVATLLPQRKDMRQMFQRIILHFDRHKAMVSQVELIEKNGDRTIIELKNIRSNVSIPAKVFAVN